MLYVPSTGFIHLASIYFELVLLANTDQHVFPILHLLCRINFHSQSCMLPNGRPQKKITRCRTAICHLSLPTFDIKCETGRVEEPALCIPQDCCTLGLATAGITCQFTRSCSGPIYAQIIVHHSIVHVLGGSSIASLTGLTTSIALPFFDWLPSLPAAWHIILSSQPVRDWATKRQIPDPAGLRICENVSVR